jgi:hypothetical protein
MHKFASYLVLYVFGKQDVGEVFVILLLILLGIYLELSPLIKKEDGLMNINIFLSEKPALGDRGEGKQSILIRTLRKIYTNETKHI